jgi:hypothetical protein
MLQFIKMMGLLPVVGKIVSWAIDKWISDPKARAEAKAKQEAAIQRITNDPRSEAQEISDQWGTIKAQDVKPGTGTPSQG